ncbi:MAG: hypothetical protein RIR17_2024, partial [Planctomycetota bacterium]
MAIENPEGRIMILVPIEIQFLIGRVVPPEVFPLIFWRCFIMRAQWLLGVASICWMGLVSFANAEVKLPKIFSNSMVLQRDRAVPVWGWDNPGTEVTVSIGETSAKAKADANGKWTVQLPAMKAGGPHVLKVEGSSKVEFSDVLFGEVWLCSGQSN